MLLARTYSHQIIDRIVGSKYGSNENYDENDKNDGFSTPQTENKTRKNSLFFFTRMQCLSQD